jgi:hypothetical protein
MDVDVRETLGFGGSRTSGGADVLQHILEPTAVVRSGRALLFAQPVLVFCLRNRRPVAPGEPDQIFTGHRAIVRVDSVRTESSSTRSMVCQRRSPGRATFTAATS